MALVPTDVALLARATGGRFLDRNGMALVGACGAGILLTACAVAPTPNTASAQAASPAVEQVAFKDRRMSEFTPDFIGKSYDLKCGDCAYWLVIDACGDLGRASAVVRATVSSEDVLATQCDQRTEHDSAYSCIADVAVNLRDVEILRGSLDAERVQRVATRFFYQTHGNPKKTEFLKSEPYFLFVYANQAPQRFGTAWMAEAVCPAQAQ